MQTAIRTTDERPVGSVPLRRRALDRLPAGAARTDALALLLSAALAAAGRADLWFVVVCTVVARVTCNGDRTLLSKAPAAVLLTGGMMIALLTGAGVLGIPLLTSTVQTRTALAGASLVLLLASAARREGQLRPADPLELLACLPAALVLAVGTWLSQQPLKAAVGGFLHGWDSSAHLLMSADIGRAGVLVYDDAPYPRGLHALVALTANARGPAHVSPELLELYLRTQSLAAWVVYALFTATVGLTTLRLAHVLGFSTGAKALLALVAGLTSLTPYFFVFTMVYGFFTTIGVAFVLAVVGFELLHPRSLRASLMLLALAAVATAHTYQLALPVLTGLLSAVVVAAARSGPARRATVFLVPVLLSAAAFPPAWSVVRNVGVGGVSIPGDAMTVPVALLACGVAAALWHVAVVPAEGTRALASMVLACGVLAAVSAWIADASLTDYYPRKLLWHTAALALPLLGPTAAIALKALTRRSTRATLPRLLNVALAVVALLGSAGLAAPTLYLFGSGAWDVRGDPTGIAMRPSVSGALCAEASKDARLVAARLLNFYSDPAVIPSHVQAAPSCPHVDGAEQQVPRA